MKKGYVDGTHRAIEPARTLERLAPVLAPAGITRVADVTGLDRIGIPVFMVCRPNSRSVAVSQGKGLDRDAARASGLMESIETWHAERIASPLILGSFEDLVASHPLVDVDALPARADSRFAPSAPLLWIEGRDLGTGAAVLLPYEMVHSNYTVPRPTGHGCFPASTNGLASGNDFLEAACHAACEVIERDSTSVWHHLGADARAATRLDPSSIDDERCLRAIAQIEAAEMSLTVWDTTTDVGIASFYCVLLDERDRDGHMGAGAGCHPVRGIALLRAITEAVQTRTTYIAGSRDDLGPEEYTLEGIRTKHRVARHLMRGRAPPASFSDVPTFESDSFERDIEWILSRVERAGAGPVVAVDLSRDAMPVAVVRVVIPGLEAPHDEDDYVPGRRAEDAAEGAS